MELKVGQIVKSKAGHEKGKLFVIIKVEDEYIYMSDGKARSVLKPKKKNKKHVQGVNYITEDFELLNKNLLEISSFDTAKINLDIIKTIKSYETIQSKS